MLHDALDLCDGPAVIRYPKTAAVSVDPHEVGAGLQGSKVREGRDLCFLAVGKMLAAAKVAAETLSAVGIEATIWDERVVQHDRTMIADHAEQPHVITIDVRIDVKRIV